jgi:DNA-binding MarR family transcriptional regulator
MLHDRAEHQRRRWRTLFRRKALGDLFGGTVTPLLKRLERDGLLRRGRDPANERHFRVELTEAGHALRWKAGAARGQIVCALGGTEEPIQALKREIDRVTALLEHSESEGDGASR